MLFLFVFVVCLLFGVILVVFKYGFCCCLFYYVLLILLFVCVLFVFFVFFCGRFVDKSGLFVIVSTKSKIYENRK